MQNSLKEMQEGLQKCRKVCKSTCGDAHSSPSILQIQAVSRIACYENLDLKVGGACENAFGIACNAKKRTEMIRIAKTH